MWAPAANALATFILAIIIITGHVSFWDFIWVSAFNGTIMALSIPARTAFIPEIVGEKLMFNAMAYGKELVPVAIIMALIGSMIGSFVGLTVAELLTWLAAS